MCLVSALSAVQQQERMGTQLAEIQTVMLFLFDHARTHNQN